jgi:hypothetical protein
MFAASGCKSAGTEKQIKQSVGAKINIFLIGMLSGVMMAAAFTCVFAIPANNYHWQTEIWKRGGAAWTFDMKSGHMDWKWMVEPKADTRRQKRVTVPPSAVKVRAERL